jgi:hypothetical protein
MSHRRAAFLWLVGRCIVRGAACVRLVFFVLPGRGELVLPFQIQFEFGLSELFFELLIPFCKLRIAFSLGVNGPVQAGPTRTVGGLQRVGRLALGLEFYY